MPTKKRNARQAEKTLAFNRQLKSDLRKLKEKGLYSGDLRRKPTGYGHKVRNKFKDVLEGKAAVVSAPSRKEARAFSDTFKVKRNKIVVPKQKGDRVRYNSKSGAIEASRKAFGKRIKITVVSSRKGTWHELPSEKKGRFYRIPFGSGGIAYTFDSRAELAKFMEPYEQKAFNPYRDWCQYVEVLDVHDEGELFE